MSTEVLNFDQIETYLKCPQKWEYEDALELQPEENTRSFDRRQKLLQIALLTVYRSNENAGEAAARKAMGFVDRNWGIFTDKGLYLSERQEEFDKSVTKQALRTYLENYWDEHLSSVVERGGATGVQIEGRDIETELDLLNERSDGTLVAYQYVPTLRSISFSYPGEDKAKRYLDRDEYTGRYLPSILRAELAIRGVAEDQDVDTDDIRYVVVGLHDSVTTAAGSGSDGAILAPLPAAVLLTVLHLAVNEILGVRRWTAMLAYPAVFVFIPLIVYALARRTFVWGGRRYRWRGKFDVTVLD